MEENKNNVTEERTFTKQEVENIVAQINNQARMQCENMAKRCQFLEEQLMFKRLDYLFKVIENAGNFDMEFVQKCTKEIEAGLTIPEVQEDGVNITEEE